MTSIVEFAKHAKADLRKPFGKNLRRAYVTADDTKFCLRSYGVIWEYTIDDAEAYHLSAALGKLPRNLKTIYI